ncbi:MAG TPA: family 10 glycosylhydrolase [Thermoanaerobaculia bacterium]
MRKLALAILMVVLCASASLADSRVEYRTFWVDTFNTNLNNHADVVAVVNNAKAAKANAIFAQVRRRGDSFYLNSLEPLPDFLPIAAGFDPLADLITEAHAEGIEVHAFVIIGAVWSKNPTFAPSPTLGPPLSPNHVFNLHGGYDPVSRKIVPGSNNWLTRQYPTFAFQGSTFDGHRFGSDFWIDLGHPDAAEYTLNVLMQLIRNYSIDGVHLDRIRYPEISATGQTPSTGTNIGYNPTSVERYQRRYGIAVGSTPPAINDPQWSQWRRDQVSNFVRRLYLNAIAVKPQLKMSGALIAFGGGPTTEASWSSAEAYWRVYQDWRAWTEEGILDLPMPMAYKREHTAAEVTQFNQWNEWLKNHQYNRAGVMGVGGLLNAVEGTLRQTRRALLEPSSKGKMAAGVIFFSMATSNVAVTANPFSIPAGQNTPLRPFSEFAAGLTTSKSVNGVTLYEPAGSVPLFADPAPVPVLSWKAAPTRGHLMGFAKRPDGTAVDAGTVTIQEVITQATRTTVTDGQGFFGGVDLDPGQYLVKIELGSEVFYSCPANVTAGTVARADVGFDPPPQITAPADITVGTDLGACSATVIPGNAVAIDNCGTPGVTGARSDGLALTAAYPKGVTTITWTATDSIGQKATATQRITVADQEPPRIQAPSDITTSTDPGMCSATVAVGTASATDNCAGVTVSGTRSDHLALTSAYPKGMTTIIWTATDAAGLTASATQKVVVVDSEPPAITGMHASKIELWPANHKMVSVDVSYLTEDNCGSVTASLSVNSNEPEDGLGDGDTAPDWEVVNEHEVRLRAERAGNGSGRIYTITATAVDADGNVSTATVTVMVPLNQSNGRG